MLLYLHRSCTAHTSSAQCKCPLRGPWFSCYAFTLSLNGCCFRCCTAAGSAGSHPQKGYRKYFRFNLGLISVLDMLTFFISTVFQKGCLGGYLILWRLLVGSVTRFSRPVASDCVSRQARHSVPCWLTTWSHECPEAKLRKFLKPLCGWWNLGEQNPKRA